MHQIRFHLALLQTPLGELTALPRTLQLNLRITGRLCVLCVSYVYATVPLNVVEIFGFAHPYFVFKYLSKNYIL